MTASAALCTISTPSRHRSWDCVATTAISGACFDYEASKKRIAGIDAELEDPAAWRDIELNQRLSKERTRLQAHIDKLDRVGQDIADIEELLELTDAGDQQALGEIASMLGGDESLCEELRLEQLFSGKFDACNAFLSIQSGSGGLEAQDWAQMLMRMYLRWAERRQFTSEVVEYSPDEAAGIKSCVILISGERAYGWLRHESGVHRLVRKSPFDSGKRRHTSFAAVNVEPELAQSAEVEINPAELRIDVYRASGAGGQHVNRTESAVRITHLPTRIVTQCQSSRSQHKNKATAMKQLRAKLLSRQESERQEQISQQESEKSDISWGSQIRSYVLDQSRIKDLRTDVSIGDTQAVLDGRIDDFLTASLYHMSKRPVADGRK